MKKIILFLTVLITTAAQAQEQSTVHAFSLADAVNYAQKNNVQVKNALLDIEALPPTLLLIVGNAADAISLLV